MQSKFLIMFSKTIPILSPDNFSDFIPFTLWPVYYFPLILNCDNFSSKHEETALSDVSLKHWKIDINWQLIDLK